MSANKWAEIISAALKQKPVADTVPDGWFTCREIGKMLGLSIPHVNTRVKAAIESGVCESRPFRINTGNRCIRVPHYKFHERPRK